MARAKKFGRSGLRERKENIRTEKSIGEDRTQKKILFSFKDLDIDQIPPGQDYDQWQREGLLAYMLEEFGHL